MLYRTKRQKAIQASVKDPKGSINGSYDLNSSGFEKGDTARRSRTTERSELVSEEAEQHRITSGTYAQWLKSEHVVFMCGCLVQVICPRIYAKLSTGTVHLKDLSFLLDLKNLKT